MSETQLSKSIRGALEASGVWVMEVQSEEPGTPELLLPEYCAWLRVEQPDPVLGWSQAAQAWDEKARSRRVRVAAVAGVLEAQIQVSMWQEESPQQNPPAWRKARAKYVTRGSLRLVK